MAKANGNKKKTKQIAVGFSQRLTLNHIKVRALAQITSMSFVRIWVHAVFSTRNREPYFTSEIRAKLFEHIRQNCREKGIFLDAIGGWSDHVHILLSLGREQNIAKAMMLIKGASAHWLNKQSFFNGKFVWQDDYFAISVSESQVCQVRQYIEKQEEHHRAVPFERELQTLEKVVRGGMG